MCQKETYRMLRDWPSEVTDADQNVDHEEIENITDDVVFGLSQELRPRKTKLSRSQRPDKRKKVNNI